MDWDLLWKAVIIVIGGTFLLRLAGRKSISQMTLAQTVIMIGIGSLLIQPIAGESIWATLGVGLVLVLTLIVMEYAQVKANSFENILTGKSKILIENGILQEKNLKKFRLTVDQLEMNLRQQSVSRIEDVKWATLEPNGRVAVVLKDDAQPVTKKEFQQLTSMMEQILLQRNQPVNVRQSSPNLPPISPDQPEPLFDEVHSNSHDNKPPKHLQ